MMAFDSLSEKLQNVFKNLRSKGQLDRETMSRLHLKRSEDGTCLKQMLTFKVVKQFVKAVQERAIGQDVMNGLTSWTDGHQDCK